MITKETLSPQQTEQLLKTLAERFEKNNNRHEAIAWPELARKLQAQPKKLWSLQEMEKTGGEPDVIGHDPETGEYIFCDCSTESPLGRRNLCYDQQARQARKANKPAGSALEAAAQMGIELLTEAQYRALQNLGAFDTKTSSWIATPKEVRALGGAFFGDRRYDHVFVYHNGAESYYGARGFRGLLQL